MSKHDPFCYQFVEHCNLPSYCFCDLIASVRADAQMDVGTRANVIIRAKDERIVDLLEELAEAEAVAARLVEVICDRESDYRNAIWELGVIYNAIEAAHAIEAVAAKLVEVIRMDDLRLRTWKDHMAQWMDVAHIYRRERDAALAEVEKWRLNALVAQHERDMNSAEIDRMAGELSSIREEHEAEVKP